MPHDTRTPTAGPDAGRAPRSPRLLRPVLLAALLAASVATPASAGEPTPEAGLEFSTSGLDTTGREALTSDQDATSYAAQVLTQVNDERRRNRRRTLATSACMARFADSWSSHMARTETMKHSSLLPVRRCGARRVGENVAYGNVTPTEMVDMWMQSAGHRANILSPTFTHVGIGVVRTSTGRYYATQSFASLR